MTTSGRERLLGRWALAILALLAADRYALSPLLGHARRLEGRQVAVVSETERARAAFERRGRQETLWRERTAAGLAGDATTAEGQVLNALREWCQESGLVLSSVRPDGRAVQGPLTELAFQAVGTGPMESVARFLWRLETSGLPLRVHQLQLTSRKEGGGDALDLQLRLSTLCGGREAGS